MSDMLTHREREIYDLLLVGSTPKEIGFTLNITYDTVKVHQKSIYKKLDVKNINEFIAKYKNAADVSDLWKENIRSAFFVNWNKFRDSNSTIKFEESCEEINGQVEKCFSISGVLADIEPVYAGVHGVPDDLSLEAFKTIKSFSFKTLGDGNRYHIKLATSETKGSADHYLFPFSAEKEGVSNVVVNIPGDLTRAGWSGLNEEFIQANILFIAIQPVHFGHFELKVWDFKLYR